MVWERSDRFDPRAVRLADRHYSRQKPGTPQFMNPGYCFIQAGFRAAGKSEGGLLVFQMLPDEMPAALVPTGGQFSMLEAA